MFLCSHAINFAYNLCYMRYFHIFQYFPIYYRILIGLLIFIPNLIFHISIHNFAVLTE